MSKQEINKLANKKIQEQCIQQDIYSCELRLPDCWGNWECHPAHRHKRNWYLLTPELLFDFNQWVLACNNCHTKIEFNKELTEKVFIKLRGEENGNKRL